ncbi:hypothetical protein [Pacificibacter marinus]|uniref:Uncharacterized protein n=1 Tax=Pacificibacter marinus TaxID=658057 RepID=A0A1Y5SWY9_9RHOB|nr:hypothetical protein [Pacificibacter marinus]SEK83588.1 hypothetical protein SAMN04488032_10746 [Pacificibacter marinus]SLN48457.1 hypothetical protein PAM7971_02367 [Pacificibacter marinus]
MQISNAYSQAAQTASSATRHGESSAQDASTNTQNRNTTDVQSSKRAVSSDAVFAKHDLTDISPRDVDKMAKELRASGYDDVGFILGLETRGEKWRSHMTETLNDAGYEFDPNYDPTRPTDVIASVKEQLDMSHRFGDPTEYLSDQLSKMERANAQAHPQTAPTGTSSQLAQTLVLFQAQRIWVE